MTEEEKKEIAPEETSTDDGQNPGESTIDADNNDDKKDDKSTDDTTTKDNDVVDDGAEPEGGPVAKKEVKKDDTEDEEEDEDELSPEDEKKLSRFLDKKLAPFQQKIQHAQLDGEVKTILEQHPEYKPYEARIRRFVTHPNRAGLIQMGLPVKSVVLEAVAPYLEKITADKVKAADAKAAQTRVDGATSRPNDAGMKVDYSKLTNKEIEEIGELVKQGRYKPS